MSYLRILHIVQNLDLGGMERIIVELARRTDAARFDVHILVLHHIGHLGQGVNRYATVHVANPMSRWSMIRPAELSSQISQIEPDVVHVHSGVWFKASRAARMAECSSVVYTDHGRQNPDPLSYRLQDYIASYYTDRVIAVSDVLAKKMQSFVHTKKKIKVIANGVDTARFSAAGYDGSLHRELSLNPGTPLIGSTGRLETVKGYDVMIRAYTELLRVYPGSTGTPAPHLILIGEGSQKANLKRLAQESGVSDRIHFLGLRDDIQQCLSAFDIFTMSSHSEGTSVSLLEAMSCSLCPIVTDVGGNRAVLGSSLQHRLVPPDNPQALGQAWKSALEDPARRQTDALRARQIVEEKFSLDAMVRRYENLYEDVLRTKRKSVNSIKEPRIA